MKLEARNIYRRRDEIGLKGEENGALSAVATGPRQVTLLISEVQNNHISVIVIYLVEITSDLANHSSFLWP